MYRTWPAERKLKAKQPWATGRKAPPAPAAGPSRWPPEVLPGPLELPPYPPMSVFPSKVKGPPLQYAFTCHTVSKTHSRYSKILLNEWNVFKVLSLTYLFCGTQSLVMSTLELFPRGAFLRQHRHHIPACCAHKCLNSINP